MSFDPAAGGLTPYFILLVVGFLPSEIWRWASVFLARGLDEGSEIFVFIRTAASVLLVGVVARLILAPAGELAHVPMSARLAALTAAGGAFVLFRRSVFAAILAGEAAIILAGWRFAI